MTDCVEQEIQHFLRTGGHDVLSAAWPGASVIDRMATATTALREALTTTVLERSRHATMPDGIAAADLFAITRAKVKPMVLGLFPASEQPIVLGLLSRSVVYLTPDNIATVLRSELDLNTVWNLANLYLLSCNTELLSAVAPQIIGFSQETTCFVSMKYFAAGGRFDDIVVHEAAHIFHNCKRERVGLEGTRRREWLLEIDFRKRETFAYACEALSRIHELGATPRARRAILEEFEAGPMPSDERVDADELLDILNEAVGARNGWKRILKRCAPLPVQRSSVRSAPR